MAIAACLVAAGTLAGGTFGALSILWFGRILGSPASAEGMWAVTGFFAAFGCVAGTAAGRELVEHVRAFGHV